MRVIVAKRKKNQGKEKVEKSKRSKKKSRKIKIFKRKKVSKKKRKENFQKKAKTGNKTLSYSKDSDGNTVIKVSDNWANPDTKSQSMKI